jgi:hypothetical protein
MQLTDQLTVPCYQEVVGNIKNSNSSTTNCTWLVEQRLQPEVIGVKQR